MCCVRLELPVKCPRFCLSIHRERYLSHFIDEWQCFLSTFLYKLKNALYEQPQIRIFSKRLHRQWRCISQKFMLSIRNSRLLHQLRMDFEWIGSFCLIILTHPYQYEFFQPKYGKVTATGLEPRTTWFLNEHSTIWPNWPNELCSEYLSVRCIWRYVLHNK